MTGQHGQKISGIFWFSSDPSIWLVMFLICFDELRATSWDSLRLPSFLMSSEGGGDQRAIGVGTGQGLPGAKIFWGTWDGSFLLLGYLLYKRISN